MQHNPRSYSFVGATSEPLTIEPGGYGLVVPVIETGGPCRAELLTRRRRVVRHDPAEVLIPGR